MFYNPTRLMAIYADMPLDLLRFLMVFGVMLSVLMLAISGGLVRNWLGIYKAERKPWALDISLGLIVGAAWFVFKSLIPNLTGIPFLTFEQEPVVLLAIASFFFSRTSLQQTLSEMRGKESCLYFAVILVSIYSFGYWRAFDLIPASSDPGVLSTITDNFRLSGYMRLSLSDWNSNVPNYPAGMMLLTWAFANPLIPTISLYHLWPHITVTLMAFMAWEICIKNQKLDRKAFLSGVVVVLLARVLVGSFDVSLVWKNLEGYSKRTGGFLVLIWFAFVFDVIRDQLQKRPFFWTLALGFWSLSLLALINPINTYISAACAAVGGLVFVFKKGVKLAWVLAGGLVALPVVMSGIVQDPMVMQIAGRDGPTCLLFGDQVSYCKWTLEQQEQAKKAALQVEGVVVQDDWKKNLPPFLQPGQSPFYQSQHFLFHNEAAALKTLLLLAVIVLIVMTVQRREWGLKWIRYSLILIGSYLLALVFAYGQAFVLSKVVGPDRSWLISPYMNISLINLWNAVYYVVVAAAIVVCIKSKSWRGKYNVGLLVFAVVLIGLGSANHKGAAKLRERLGLKFGGETPRLASIVSQIDRRLPKDANIFLPSYAFQAGPELWNILQKMSDLQMLYLQRKITFNYSGLWPLGAPSAKEHFRELCDLPDACSYLRKHGVEWAIDFDRDRPMMCGMTLPDYFAKIGCFSRAFEVETSKAKIKAVGYRLQ